MKLLEHKGVFRLSCFGLFFIVPFYWLSVAIKELWRRESVPKVYGYLWKAFKKGGKL